MDQETVIQHSCREKASPIFVTGATGFLGSHLTVALLKRGIPVIALVRPKKGIGAVNRMERLLRWFDIEEEERKRLEVIEGFLDQPHFTLTTEAYARLLETANEIFHCAADTSFSERKRSKVETANLTGLETVLDVAAQGNCRRFHHLSTAYAAGKQTGHCPESLVDPSEFTNVYEETKYLGEKRVIEACTRQGIPCNIYRPSIVYGDSVTGKTLRFNALYYPVRTAFFLKNLYLDDFRENHGKNAGKTGVRLETDGRMHLPIRIEKSETGRLNVIPVDFFVTACMALMEECREGGVFHIVSRRPKRLDDLVDYTQRFFRITGIRAAEISEFQKTPRNAFELLVQNYIDIYQPYMQDRRIFDSEKTDAVLARQGIQCPDFDYETFARCMNYAMTVDWGKRLYQEGILV